MYLARAWTSVPMWGRTPTRVRSPPPRTRATFPTACRRRSSSGWCPRGCGSRPRARRRGRSAAPRPALEGLRVRDQDEAAVSCGKRGGSVRGLVPAVARARHRLASTGHEPRAKPCGRRRPSSYRRSSRPVARAGPRRASPAVPNSSSQNAAPSATAATPPAATPSASRRVALMPVSLVRVRAELVNVRSESCGRPVARGNRRSGACGHLRWERSQLSPARQGRGPGERKSTVAGALPTRTCEKCAQTWESARFLDPTIETDCGFCGGRLIRPERRRPPRPELVKITAAPAEPTHKAA